MIATRARIRPRSCRSRLSHNGIYRSNVDDQLSGQVPDEAVEFARDGIGVIAANASTLSPEVAQTTFATASESFIDAMNSGFWLSAAIMASAALAAAVLLPRNARTDQVERMTNDPVELDTVGDPLTV